MPRASLLIAAIALVGLNRAPHVVAIGPLAETIRIDTGLGPVAIGLLTTLPVVCFGVFAPVAPRLARRIGLRRAVLASLVLLLLGVAVRLLSPPLALFIGSVVAGTGIALANVLVPGIVKRDFVERTGFVMTVYAIALNVGAALAAGLTVPLREGLDLDWRTALAAWGGLALAAVVLWIVATRREMDLSSDDGERYPVWSSPLAWAAAWFIGLQSLVFYALVAWVPTLLQDSGMSESRAGLMLSLLAFFGIAGALTVPVAAARLERQRALALLVVACFLIGLVGLITAPISLALLWMIVLGIAQGAGISLALTLFVLRSRTGAGATQLSAMAQTVGYLVAAAGPLLAGVLYDLTGGWNGVLISLIIVLVPLARAGWIAGSSRTLEDEIDPHPVDGEPYSTSPEGPDSSD